MIVEKISLYYIDILLYNNNNNHHLENSYQNLGGGILEIDL